jgi:hypothetical protein
MVQEQPPAVTATDVHAVSGEVTLDGIGIAQVSVHRADDGRLCGEVTLAGEVIEVPNVEDPWGGLAGADLVLAAFAREGARLSLDPSVRPEATVTPPEGVHAGAIALYLDSSIRFWRGVRDGTVAPPESMLVQDPETVKLMATCYVDAAQSTRVSLLGTTLD